MNRLKIYISIFVPFLAVVISASIFSEVSRAEEIEKDRGAVISDSFGTTTVDRAEVLKVFLEKYNSPLVENVDTFVRVADKYGIDYRLLPAISCMESTCGKFLLPESYNAWGWGIYGNNAIYFKNYDQAIETVAKGIYEGYHAKGLDTPAKMAPIYTPPKAQHWLSGVTSFMRQMDAVAESLETNNV